MGDATVTEVQEIRPIIYVTGFGPFSSHAVNASQMAVEGLVDQDLERELGVKLVTEILKVEYNYVQKTIPQRWEDLNPKLTVHVGVSSLAETLTLEQLAHNSGYNGLDNCGCLPHKGLCIPDSDEVIQSGIRMDLISSAINKNTKLKLPCAKSTDPGRFLCDFVYYLSLKKDRSRSAFIHVPTLNKFSAQDISAAIAAAIKEMYNQVMERDNLDGSLDLKGLSLEDHKCNEISVGKDEGSDDKISLAL
ncbi:pyroglutamyl-peptidase 1 isoform X1 [Panulirus ornatus]|uniref:pyroglutamyl-peptidase 1 isoform X1 n=1 Tax=Panulirus ornatus TaxID=150431 RepID=UPI003A845044